MTMKDNPNYLTTKEVYDTLRCGRSYVQKLDAAGKLPRAGVEDGRVYYARRDVEALLDEKAYGRGAQTAPMRHDLPSLYQANDATADAQLRRIEHAYLKSFEIPRPAPAVDPNTGLRDSIEQLRIGQTEQGERQSDAMRRMAERVAASKVDWAPLLIGGAAFAGLIYLCSKKMRENQEAARAEQARAFELQVLLVTQKGTERDLHEYLSYRWKEANPDDERPWFLVWGRDRREFELEEKIRIGIATNGEKSERVRILWRRFHPDALRDVEGASDSGEKEGDGGRAPA